MWPFKKIAKDLYLLDQVQQRLQKNNLQLAREIVELRSELGLISGYRLSEEMISLKDRISKLEEQNGLLLDYLKVKVTEIKGTPTKKVITKAVKK